MNDFDLMKAITRIATQGQGPPARTLDEIATLLAQREQPKQDAPAKAPEGRTRQERGGRTRTSD